MTRAPLEAPLLPEVERGERGGEREAREGGEHEADVEGEEEAPVVGVPRRPGAAARVREREQRRRGRDDREAEEAEARPAAPDEVRADDEPHEEVEHAAPARPREAVRARGLDDEQRGLDEPAEPHAPGREAARQAGPPRLAHERERGLAIGEERGPEQKLSQRAPPPAGAPRAAPARAP